MSYPKIYLDTNIIRDCIKRRKDISLTLLKEINVRNIECITGIFTLLELWNIEKQEAFFFKAIRKGSDLNTIIRNRHQMYLNESDLNEINEELDRFFAEYNQITTVQLAQEGWKFAFAIARTTSIGPADILQLATALGEKCDVLISNDSYFSKEAKKFVSANDFLLQILDSRQAELSLNNP